MRVLRFTPAFVIALLLPLLSAAHAQSTELVVQVSTRLVLDEPDDNSGTGIIVANNGETATIVTAAHVVDLRGQVAVREGEVGRTSVSFYRDGRNERPAKLILYDPQMDLAVISVPSSPELKEQFLASRDVLMPTGFSPRPLKDRVVILGTRDGVPWSRSERPAPLVEVGGANEPHRILFDSDVASPGFSGGPLFSTHGVLIGMVLQAGRSDVALDITYIRKSITEAGLQFGLTENQAFVSAIAKSILEEDGNLTETLIDDLYTPEPNFSRLHLYWIANVDPKKIERAFRARSRTSIDGAVIEDFLASTKDNASCKMPDLEGGHFENVDEFIVLHVAKRSPVGDWGASCDANLTTWFKGLVRAGFNPDLVFQGRANSENSGKQSLLAFALRLQHAEATIGLLRAGATPNPFVDLNGNLSSINLFQDPTAYVARRFAGLDRDLVLSEIQKAGAHMSDLGASDIESLFQKDILLDFGEARKREPRHEFCASLVKRYGFDWCNWSKSIPVGFQLFEDLSNSSAGLHDRLVAIESLIWADETFAYFFAVREVGSRGELDSGILRVSRRFDDIVYFQRRRGVAFGCRRDPEDPDRRKEWCWRPYHASMINLGASVRVREDDPEHKGWQSRLVEQAQVHGISLVTPFDEAHKLLINLGYEPTNLEGKSGAQGQFNQPNSGLGVAEIRYVRTGQHSTRPATELVLIGFRNRIVLIYRYGPDTELEWLKAGIQTPEGFDIHEVQRERYAGRDVDQILLVKGSPGHKFGLAKRIHYNSALTVVVERSALETEMERAFLSSRIREFFGASRITKDGRCLDNLSQLKGLDENGCQSRLELANRLLAENLRRPSVLAVSSDVHLEVIQSNDGPKVSSDRPINITYEARLINLVSPEDTGEFLQGDTQSVLLRRQNISKAWHRKMFSALRQLRVGDHAQLLIKPNNEDGLIASDLISVNLQIESP